MWQKANLPVIWKHFWHKENVFSKTFWNKANVFENILRKANVSGMFCSKKQLVLENILEKQNVSDKQSTKHMFRDIFLLNKNGSRKHLETKNVSGTNFDTKKMF